MNSIPASKYTFLVLWQLFDNRPQEGAT
jgi:hypothetical protein